MLCLLGTCSEHVDIKLKIQEEGKGLKHNKQYIKSYAWELSICKEKEIGEEK